MNIWKMLFKKMINTKIILEKDLHKLCKINSIDYGLINH